MSKSTKLLGKWSLCVFIFCVSLYVIAYLWGSHGEAFRFVERTIKASDNIELKVGHVQRITLDPVGGYREKFVNANKTVYMVVDVTGSKGKVTVKVVARKINGTWEIKNTSIDG